MTRVAVLLRRAALENNNNNINGSSSSANNEFRQDPRSNRGDAAYMSETNFDTNMVIILAALLCALICALGLNSIVRCALRCSRHMVSESSEDVASRLANTGIKRKTLRSLPITIYSCAASTAAASGELCSDCPICLAEFVQGEKVRTLPKCNHAFHVKCVDPWLLSHSSCPTCRQCLLEISPDNNGGDMLVILPDNNGGAGALRNNSGAGALPNNGGAGPSPRAEAPLVFSSAAEISTAQHQIPTQFYI